MITTIPLNTQRPHGIAFRGNILFVASETQVDRYTWNHGKPQWESTLLTLPAGGRHFTRTLAFDDQDNMYISLGSTCDACEEKHPWFAAVIRTDADGSNPTVIATGLRNAVFLEYEPATQSLWASEMGRDRLGDTLPPDEINRIETGHYGWPHCFGQQEKDRRSGQPTTADFDCSQTRAPAFALPAHVAPLGVVVIDSTRFPKEWQGDLLVALHGSWNSSVPVGYKVIRLEKDETTITATHDFITQFLQGTTTVARSVDLEFLPDGSLVFSDDKAGTIFLVPGPDRVP